MDTILIVDALEANASAARKFLEASGFGTLHLSAYTDALATAEQAQPALILIDTFMPEMAGFTLTRALNRNPATDHIPVIMMAAPPYAGHKIRALWYGARELIVKPIDERELLDAVHALVGGESREPSLASN